MLDTGFATARQPAAAPRRVRSLPGAASPDSAPSAPAAHPRFHCQAESSRSAKITIMDHRGGDQGRRCEARPAGLIQPRARRNRFAAQRREAINEDRFNMDIRKFLKAVGVTSQREIEMAVRAALAKGGVADNTVLKPKMVLSIPEIGLEHVIDGEIGLS